ncbi:MAG: ABC transporter permease [Coraliomargarita sp.]
MRLSNTLRLSIASLTAHPFRSFLAGLGVVFGVGAVVGMLAIGEGARLESIRQIQEMGVDKIIVSSVQPEGKEDSDSSGSSIIGITKEDIRHFQNEFDNVKAVLPITHWNGTAISQWTEAPNSRLLGVPIEFLDLTNSKLIGSRSRFISEQDIEDSAPICIIGSAMAKTLFQFRDPIGERIMLRGTYFTIVGILHHQADRKIDNVGNINHMIYLPSTTGFNYWSAPVNGGYQSPYTLLYVAISDIDQIENTARRMESYMYSTHQNDDYEIVLPFELMKQQESTQRIFTIVMASIASISLLVGGIGIMNIMLANIYERMKEIGTRRALGATRRDILIQFLVESMALTAMGGAIGALLGVLMAFLVAQYADMPTQVTVVSIIISLTVSVATGVIFGSFPAWKAANLSPMEALRHE